LIGVVHCDVSSLEQSQSGAVWGGVWISAGQQHFPEPGWNDMVVALLVELHRAINQIRRANGSARVRFFDGPFWMDLKLEQGDKLSISASGQRAGIGLTDTVDLAPFERSLMDESALVLRECELRGWGDQTDVRILANLVRH